jgi:hypothetical protein
MKADHHILFSIAVKTRSTWVQPAPPNPAKLGLKFQPEVAADGGGQGHHVGGAQVAIQRTVCERFTTFKTQALKSRAFSSWSTWSQHGVNLHRPTMMESKMSERALMHSSRYANSTATVGIVA